MSWFILLLQDIPIIGKGITQIVGLFTKTPAQQAEKTASDTQKDTNSIDKTGRPS